MTTLWVWGTGWVMATLVSRQRAPGLDRCGYSGGPPPQPVASTAEAHTTLDTRMVPLQRTLVGK